MLLTAVNVAGVVLKSRTRARFSQILRVLSPPTWPPTLPCHHTVHDTRDALARRSRMENIV